MTVPRRPSTSLPDTCSGLLAPLLVARQRNAFLRHNHATDTVFRPWPATVGRTTHPPWGMPVPAPACFVHRTGRALGLRRSVVRAALCVTFPLGLCWIPLSRTRASLQDLVVASAVFYDGR